MGWLFRKNAELLEILQQEAARIVTALTRSVSLENLYKNVAGVRLQ